MTDRNQYIEIVKDEIATVMCRRLEALDALDLPLRKTATRDYGLRDIKSAVAGRISIPKNVHLMLRGYELIVENPTPVYIRFGIGNLWIGARLIVIRSLEQVVDILCHLITEVIPVALQAYILRKDSFERDFAKYLRLKSITETANQIQRQYGYQYQH